MNWLVWLGWLGIALLCDPSHQGLLIWEIPDALPKGLVLVIALANGVPAQAITAPGNASQGSAVNTRFVIDLEDALVRSDWVKVYCDSFHGAPPIRL